MKVGTALEKLTVHNVYEVECLQLSLVLLDKAKHLNFLELQNIYCLTSDNLDTLVKHVTRVQTLKIRDVVVMHKYVHVYFDDFTPKTSEFYFHEWSGGTKTLIEMSSYFYVFDVDKLHF